MKEAQSPLASNDLFDIVSVKLRIAVSALNDIATSPHQEYDNKENNSLGMSSNYAIGVADGHRCAANSARAALDYIENVKMSNAGDQPPRNNLATPEFSIRDTLIRGRLHPLVRLRLSLKRSFFPAMHVRLQ